MEYNDDLYNKSHFYTDRQQQPPVFQHPQPSNSIYLMRNKPAPSDQTGATDLLKKYQLTNVYNKYCSKKMKDSLSSYICSVSNVPDEPCTEGDSSSLMHLISNVPITANQIDKISSSSLNNSFRLFPGVLPEKYHQPVEKKKNKKDKNKKMEASKEKDAKKAAKRKFEDGDKKKKKKDKKRKKDRI